ncbi:RodZ domain-containing protein [Inquilinus limosus]|nr:RodZ domain-containing protein [Inquilinus limosus]
MTTGNAGGLQVEVDGQPVASLGGPGQVVRNIQLDPQKLRDRASVN